ncbi:MAG: hypothetical protein KDD40_11510, partial [Bdellovibrionales bacterium]|nr:hypothetical protein [Bdellovibrionales bacterium]
YHSHIIGIENQGLGVKNILQLSNDIHFRKIAKNFLVKLESADEVFLKIVVDNRLAKGPKSIVHENKFKSHENSEYILGDPSFQEIFKATGFSPIEEIIASIKEELPSELSSDPFIVKKYIILMIGLFHDDIMHFPFDANGNYTTIQRSLGSSLMEDLNTIAYAIPQRFSHMYSNYLGEEDFRDFPAWYYIKKHFDEHYGEWKYNSQHLRLGYYHVNGAVMTTAFATEDLFEKNPHRNALIKFLSEKFAAAYKYISKKSVEGPIRKSLRKYIRRKHPILYARFIFGSLKLKDIVGTPHGNSFEGSFFAKALANERGELDQIVKWISNSLQDPQGRPSFSSQTQEYKQNQVIEQLLDEWMLWYKNYRTIKQHGSAIKILNEIDRRLGITTNGSSH